MVYTLDKTNYNIEDILWLLNEIKTCDIEISSNNLGQPTVLTKIKKEHLRYPFNLFVKNTS